MISKWPSFQADTNNKVAIVWNWNSGTLTATRTAPGRVALVTSGTTATDHQCNYGWTYTYSFSDGDTEQANSNYSVSSIFSMQFMLHGNLVSPLAAASEAGATLPLPVFDLLVPEKQSVGHYVRQGTRGGWRRVDQLDLPDHTLVPDTAVFILQSFQMPLRLQAIVEVRSNQGTALLAFDFLPHTGEQRSFPVKTNQGPIQQISGTPAFAQTPKLFHLLVPTFDPNTQTPSILHLVHTGQSLQQPWDIVTKLPGLDPDIQVKSLALVQADGSGSLKAIARISVAGEPDMLIAYQCDPGLNWSGPFIVSTGDIVEVEVAAMPQQSGIIKATGSPGLFHSVSGENERLELLVPSDNGIILHYVQSAFETINTPWTLIDKLLPINEDPQTQTVSASIIQDNTGNLETIAHVITSANRNLLVFYRFDPQTGWSRPMPVTRPDNTPIIVGQGNDDDNNDGDHHGDGKH